MYEFCLTFRAPRSEKSDERLSESGRGTLVEVDDEGERGRRGRNQLPGAIIVLWSCTGFQLAFAFEVTGPAHLGSDPNSDPEGNTVAMRVTRII
jgi:hypothetical protein